MRHSPVMVSALVFLGLAIAARTQEAGAPLPMFNPYDRLHNGPPLSGIFSKAKTEWIFDKLRNPRSHPSARMPDFKFSEEEALEIMAYLKSVRPSPDTVIPSPAWADKKLDDLSDDESEVVFDLLDKGKAVWSNARCSVCHSIQGPGNGIIGGFVDLRVGGIDLQIEATKLQRAWLVSWIKNPRAYFPQTLMPRFRFSDDEISALVEYILRDDAFMPPVAAESHGVPPDWKTLDEPERISRGKRLIEMSRCVVCHDVAGIPNLQTEPAFDPPSDSNTIEYIAYDLRCLSCHSLQRRGGTYAPDLTHEGSRLNPDWIVGFLQSPDMIRPLSQQMPKFNLTPEEAGIIASYMEQNRRDPRIPLEIPGGPVTEEDIQNGRKIYQAKGCISCHTVGEGPGGSVGPALEAVAVRLRPGYIWRHLKQPHAVNPYSAEPDYGFTDQEARLLAAYLASKKK